MSDNRRYSQSLIKKIEADEREEQKQAELKKKYNVEGDVKIKETSMAAGLFSVLSTIAYIIIIVLAFVALMLILHPTTRELLMRKYNDNVILSLLIILTAPILYIIYRVVIKHRHGKRGRKQS